MISHMGPHISPKLILYLMLHAGFSPQTDYFWKISDKIISHLLLFVEAFFQKPRGSFFLDKGLAI